MIAGESRGSTRVRVWGYAESIFRGSPMTITRLLIAAVAAIALSTATANADKLGNTPSQMSSASSPVYKLDAKSKCHDASGKFVKQNLCAAPSPPPTPKHCRDPKTGKIEKCSAPGSVPA